MPIAVMAAGVAGATETIAAAVPAINLVYD